MNDFPTTPAAPPARVFQTARQTAAREGTALVDALADLLQTTASDSLQQLASSFLMTVAGPQDLSRLQARFDLLPIERALKRRCLLLDDPLRPGITVAVISDPLDSDLRTLLDSLADGPLDYRLALPEHIDAFLASHEASVSAVDSLVAGDASIDERHTGIEVLNLATISETPSAAVRIVSSTLYDALKAGASDVHLESTPAGLSVKYRIDGVLDHGGDIAGVALAEQVLSRLKVLSELDIAERRIPQDGSFRVRYEQRDIDLRLSVMPSVHGEDAVVRVLDKRAVVGNEGRLTLERLGFDSGSLDQLRELARMPYGMLLVTGPTGSGKTTTLYGALSEINTGRDKIVTIEDPVEYQLPGVLQIPVNDRKGLTFARGLRSILRHDPDKIMVGEIRDRETAEIAVQSALTGHLVLTTVHANNVFDVFGRFTHMGIDPYAFASALNAIWAQRLLRIVCPHCAVTATPAPAELKALALTPDALKDSKLVDARGCPHCRHTGYRGRKAIAEVLVLDDEMRELIVDRQPIRRVKEVARQKGMRSLRAAALDLASRGETTLEEVRRVTLAD